MRRAGRFSGSRVGAVRAKGFSMKIHAGYEISYDCPQPTPMILMLSVHPSRFPDLLTEDRMRLDPPIPAKTYHDSFGNFCHVIRAPSGRLTLSTDFLVHDNGESDPTAPQAEQYALEDLPAEAYFICSVAAIARPIAYRMRRGPFSGKFGGVGRLCRRSAIMSTIASPLAMLTPARPRRVRGLRRRARRVPRLRSSRGDAVSLHERTRTVLHRLSRRHRRLP
jgi:hypothetical protein